MDIHPAHHMFSAEANAGINAKAKRPHPYRVTGIWRPSAAAGLVLMLLLPAQAFSQTRSAGVMSGGAASAASGGAIGPSGTSAGLSGAAASGATPSGTLRAVGTTVNGNTAGTSGTDPGVSSTQPAAAAAAAASSGVTLRPVGVNVDGSVAGSSGTDPGSQTLSNPLNRNPANRPVVPDASPAADSGNSLSRPTLGAVTRPDNRDTVVAPDPSRDSTTTR